VSIEFVCHNCGQELKVHEQAVGRRVRCPGCDTLLVVPEPAEIEAEEQESEELPAEASPIEEVEEPVAREEVPTPQRTSDAWKSPQELPFAAAAPPPNVTPPPISAPVMPKRQPKAQSQAKPKTVDDPPLILPPQDHPEDLIDMTAMVDIVFFLLIFFMVTSLQALEAVMNLPTPQSAEGGAASNRSVADLENDPSFITVRIEDDDSIWVEDTQVFNDQELLVRLRNAKGSAGSRSLLVIGDADASHGSAVRVFDAGAGAGVNGISLVVQEKGEGR
jgi:biopolymer transport protein ExbD